MSGIINLLIAGFSNAGLLAQLNTTGTSPKLSIKNNELYAVVDGSGFVVLKLTLNLGITWQKTLAISAATCIAIDSSGNVIAGGNNLNSTIPNGYVIKYDSSGAVQWQRQISANTQFRGIALDSADNIYCMGYDDITSSNTNIYVAKFNPSGTIQYQQRLIPNFDNPDFAESIAITSPTNLSIIGKNVGTKKAQYITADQATATSISAKKGATTTTYGVAVVAGEASGVDYSLVDKYATNDLSSRTSQVLIRSVDGVFSWQAELYSSTYPFKGAALCMDPSGTHIYTLAALTTGNIKLQLCKYIASTGAIVWQRTLGTPLRSITPYSIAVDSFDNIYAFSDISGASLVLKMPGDGSGAGSSTLLDGHIYSYIESTYSAFPGTLTTADEGVGTVASTATILTPTGVPTDSTFTMTTALL